MFGISVWYDFRSQAGGLHRQDMLRTSILIAVLLTLVVSPATAQVRTRTLAPVPAGEAFVAGDVVVKFRPGVATAKTEPLAGDFGLVRQERIERLGIERYHM